MVGANSVFFERGKPYREKIEIHPSMNKTDYDIVIFGLGRFGKAIAKLLIERKLNVLAVDFNPDEVREWEYQGYDATYGDACDIEFVSSLPLNQVKWVICTIPQHLLGVTYQDPRVILTETLKQTKFSSRIAVTTHHTSEVESLKALGVDVILQPFYDAAARAVEIILDVSESNSINTGK